MNGPKMEGLNSEEGKKKAESLFSKQFLEYLTSKKLPPNKMEKSLSHTHEKSSVLSKDFSASSDETSKSESSRKSGKRGRKKLKEKKSSWDYHYSFRNRLVQCCLLKGEEEVAPPDELKPLLMNMTILLQDLRQSSSVDLENLYNLISKITILVTEFIRRPLKKIPDDKKGEHSKNLEKAIDTMTALLEEYKNGPNLDPHNSIREYKRIEKEMASKDQEIAEIKKKLSLDNQKNDLKTKDLVLRVRSSISANEKLKSQIKFNHSHIKKYKKILLEKEWTKHKLGTELIHLKKKISKVDLSEGDSFEKEFSYPETKSDNSVTTVAKKNKPLLRKGKEMPKSIFKPK